MAVDDSTWVPPVLKVAATENQGVAELAQAVDGFVAWSDRTGRRHARRRERAYAQVMRALSACCSRPIGASPAWTPCRRCVAPWVDRIIDGDREPARGRAGATRRRDAIINSWTRGTNSAIASRRRTALASPPLTSSSRKVASLDAEIGRGEVELLPVLLQQFLERATIGRPVEQEQQAAERYRIEQRLQFEDAAAALRAEAAQIHDHERGLAHQPGHRLFPHVI